MGLFKYMLIKNHKNQELSNLKDFLQGLLGNNVEFIDDEILTIIHSYSSDEEIIESLESIIFDLQVNLKIYISKTFNLKEELDLEKAIISSYFEESDLYKNIYTERALLKELLAKGKHKDLNKIVLQEYAKDNHMLEILKVFFESNMNTSRASERLYMHRNTLINKLDKFNEKTGYDVKNFIDAFIIYHLL